MKHLESLRRTIERFSKKHDLVVDQLSAFGDGSYRVELKQPDAASKPVAGFRSEESK